MPARDRSRALAMLLMVAVAACRPNLTPAPSSGPPAASEGSTAAPTNLAALPLVIDTDMAPDDVTAIASLLRDPRVDVLAITVVGTGEAHCPGGMYVARSVLTMLDATSIPVTCGRDTPLGDAQPFPDEWRSGADMANGLRLAAPAFLPDDRTAPELLVQLALNEAAAGGRLTILTLGTLTNLAEAVRLNPGLPQLVSVVSMLGAVEVPGNVLPDDGGAEPTAEWNAHADPTAVRLVLDAGFDITLVALDATNDAPLTPELYRALESDHAAGPADLVYELWSRNVFMTTGGYFLWDPLAAAVVREPGVVTTRSATVRVVEGSALDGGRLVEDPAGARITLATGADRAAFEALMLAALRQGAPRSAPFAPVGSISVSIAPGSCTVRLDPVVMPVGIVRLDMASTAEGAASAIVFELDGIPWGAIEAFAANPDFANPPAVHQVAATFMETPGEAGGWGDLTAGPIGVACLSGDLERPNVLVRGPFQLAE